MRTIDVSDFIGAFSALVDAAEQGEPTEIMKAGRPIAVLAPPGISGHDIEVVPTNFGNFLLSFPGGLEDSSSPKLVASELWRFFSIHPSFQHLPPDVLPCRRGLNAGLS